MYTALLISYSAGQASRGKPTAMLICRMVGQHHDVRWILQVQAQVQQERQTLTGPAAGTEIKEERYGPDSTMAQEVAYVPATSPGPAAKVSCLTFPCLLPCIYIVVYLLQLLPHVQIPVPVIRIRTCYVPGTFTAIWFRTFPRDHIPGYTFPRYMESVLSSSL